MLETVRNKELSVSKSQVYVSLCFKRIIYFTSVNLLDNSHLPCPGSSCVKERWWQHIWGRCLPLMVTVQWTITSNKILQLKPLGKIRFCWIYKMKSLYLVGCRKGNKYYFLSGKMENIWDHKIYILDNKCVSIAKANVNVSIHILSFLLSLLPSSSRSTRPAVWRGQRQAPLGLWGNPDLFIRKIQS